MFCEVQESRLSPCRNQRSSWVKIENLTPPSVCFFCDSLKPDDTEEMCVVCASPRKKARLLLNPPLTPVDGFDPIEGAMTK